MNTKSLSILLAFIASISASANEILYTSFEENVVTPHDPDGLEATILSNTYANGKGVITFDGDVELIGDETFSNCSSLTSVTVGNPDPANITLGEGVFFEGDQKRMHSLCAQR